MTKEEHQTLEQARDLLEHRTWQARMFRRLLAEVRVKAGVSNKTAQALGPDLVERIHDALKYPNIDQEIA